MSARELEKLVRDLGEDVADEAAWEEVARHFARGTPLPDSLRRRECLAAVLVLLWRTPSRRDLARLVLELMDLDPCAAQLLPERGWQAGGRMGREGRELYDTWTGLPLAARLRPSGREVHLVPPVTFLQGDSPFDEYEPEEDGGEPEPDWPQHGARLDGCWIEPRPEPAESWQAAADRAEQAGGRLPREAEWEYLAEQCELIRNFSAGSPGEFCLDRYGAYRLAPPPGWEGPPEATDRVLRGGQPLEGGPPGAWARRPVGPSSVFEETLGRVARDLVPPGLAGEGLVPVPRWEHPGALRVLDPSGDYPEPRDPEGGRVLVGEVGMRLSGAEELLASPDGEYLAAGRRCDPGAIWKAGTGEALDLPGLCWPLAFSPDGTRCAAPFSDGNLRVFRLEDRRIEFLLTCGGRFVRAVEWSRPDAVHLLVDGARVELDLAGRTARERPVHCPALRTSWPGARVLLAGAGRWLIQEGPTCLRVEDLETGRGWTANPDDPPVPETAESETAAYRLLPGGAELAHCLNGGNARGPVIHRLEDGEPLPRPSALGGACDLDRDPDGTRWLAIFPDRARVLDAQEPDADHPELEFPRANLRAGCIVPGDRRVALLTRGGVVHRWTPDPDELAPLTPLMGGVHQLAVAPDGGRLATAGAVGPVEVRGGDSSDVLFRLGDEDSRCAHLAFSGDGRLLGAAFQGGRMLVVRAADGEITHDIATGDPRLRAFCFWLHWEPERGYRVHTLGRRFLQFLAEEKGFIQDNQVPPAFMDTDLPAGSEGRERVALGGPWPRIPLFDLPRGLKAGELDMPYNQRPRLIALAEAGELSAALGGPRTVSVWEHARGEPSMIGTPEGSRVSALACSHARREVAVGMESGVIELRDAGDWALRAVLVGHGGPVRALAYRSGEALVSGGEDETARAWELTPP